MGGEARAGSKGTLESGRRSDDDEPISKMQRRRREAQKDQKQLDREQKQRQLDLALEWVEHRKQIKEKQKQELLDRLANLKVMEPRSKQPGRQREDVVKQAQGPGRSAFPITRNGTEPCSESSVLAADQFELSKVYGDSASGGNHIEKRQFRKKHAEDDAPAKSVVQDLQDKFRRKLGFHTLLNDLFQAKDEVALLRLQRPRASQANQQDDADSDSDNETKPAASQRHLPRRHRLRMMRQVAQQVLQSRRRMEGCFQRELEAASQESPSSQSVCGSARAGKGNTDWPSVASPRSDKPSVASPRSDWPSVASPRSDWPSVASPRSRSSGRTPRASGDSESLLLPSILLRTSASPRTSVISGWMEREY